MCVFTFKFQVSKIILTSFRQGVVPPTPQNEPLKRPPRYDLNSLRVQSLSLNNHVVYRMSVIVLRATIQVIKKVLKVFHDMTADIISNKRIKSKKLNISLIFILLAY